MPDMKETVPNNYRAMATRQQVEQMFNRIAPRYDFLNHLLSLGMDYRWRRVLIRELARVRPRTILDVATGTGDLALACTRIAEAQITAVDIAENMLALAREKKRKKCPHVSLTFLPADAAYLPFSSASFDACTIAFGVRNFEDMQTALKEIHRVLKPGGVLAILEFSLPDRFLIRQFYLLYFRFLLPVVGRLISHDKRAYSYLPESVQNFPSPKAFCQILECCSFYSVQSRSLTGGIVTLYLARKA
jgi:demethylmenaquinone methyltransferase/2-methoxy-6-polyprenyl-1,4-benzoquinol methylase